MVAKSASSHPFELLHLARDGRSKARNHEFELKAGIGESELKSGIGEFVLKWSVIHI